MTDKNLCNSCTNVACEFQSGIVRSTCAFYMPPHIEPDNCGNYIVQYPTTKNDLEVDCISREQALRELKESAEHHANDSREEVLLRRDRDIIRNLPSVTSQEPSWIPVSERLPEEGGRYLITYSSGYVAMAYFYEVAKKWSSTAAERIVAWMPLPEPYKGGQVE